MKKYGRYGLKILAWACGILVTVWVVLLAYVALNQQQLIGKIAEKIQQQTRGEVKIGSLSVSLLRTFPIMSLQLRDVTLRDSLFAIHHKELLTARDIYLRVSLPGLISGNSALGRILLVNGTINILTDSSGYSNEYIFKRNGDAPAPKKDPSYPDVVLNNVFMTYENSLRNKLHQVDFKNTRVSMKEHSGVLNIDVRMNAWVKSLAFNTTKGGYLKGKKLAGKFRLFFDRQKSDVIVQKIRLDIDNHPFYFNGKFHIDKVSPDYVLAINTANLNYDKAVSVLTDTLQSRFNAYSFNKPITVNVELRGKTLYKYSPAVSIKMDFDLQSTNNFGSTVFELVKGKASVDILMNGPNGRGDTIITKIEGKVDIKDAEIKYLPRAFTLTNLNGGLKFINDDLVVERFIADAGSTRLEMNGLARSFVSVLNKEPEKLDVRWKISSPSVDLNDFKPFLSPAAANNNKKQGKSGSISKRIDQVFSDGDIYVLIETPQMSYKTFKATAVKADVILKKSEIALRDVRLNHASGTMEVSGSMQNGIQDNPVRLYTKMTRIDIPQLFRAFNNFGQDALTYSNLKGKLSAEINLGTLISNKAELISGSSVGTIDFLLEEGELNNFEPLMDLGNKVFKKQDFTRIEFADLKNRLDVRGTAFIVNAMDIRSTAINLSVEGIYDIKKGTDMSIQLPLKNLTKSQANTNLAEGVKPKKGVSLRLRARTGDDKKLKISWDPFKRALKNKQDVKDSADLKN